MYFTRYRREHRKKSWKPLNFSPDITIFPPKGPPKIFQILNNIYKHKIERLLLTEMNDIKIRTHSEVKKQMAAMNQAHKTPKKSLI